MTSSFVFGLYEREIDFFSFGIDGGPNFAVVLMVWVGFLEHLWQLANENISL